MNFATKALLILSTLIASPLATFLPANAANLIKNGDFEKGAFQNDWLREGNISIETDTVYQGFGAIGKFPSGRYVLAFNGGDKEPNGKISQIISTTVGKKYVLSFFYGHYKSFGTSGGTSGTQSIKVNILDTTRISPLLVSLTIAQPKGSNDLSNLLNLYSLSFIATSEFTKIEFVDVAPDTKSTDGLLDNISVNPV